MSNLTHWQQRQNEFKQASTPRRQQPLNYNTATKPLTQTIQLASRQGRQSIHLKVDELLELLDIHSGCIKGSTVGQIQTGYQQSYDIDLHLSLASETPQAWEEKIHSIRTQIDTFFSSKLAEQHQTGNRTQKIQTWARTVPTIANESFRQTVITLGQAKSGHTTIDVNFTDQNQVCYDMVSSSKHIEFNRKRKTATLNSPWCPNLQSWLSDNKWLSFNSAIDGGLKRLSYRLCKTPGAKGLQPGLADYFFDKADDVLLREIYKRALYGEYPGMQRTEAAMVGLWKPLVDALLSEEESANAKLFSGSVLSDWAGCGSLDELEQSISTDFPKLCEKWTRAATVGGDLRDLINTATQRIQNPADVLKPHINEVMGFELVQAESFFTTLAQIKSKKWEALDHSQLVSLCKPLLEHYELNAEQRWSARATNMLGWGEKKPAESLEFFLDLCSGNLANNNPPEWAKNHAVQQLLQQLEHADPLEVLTQHPRAAQLPLSRAQIVDVLGKCLQSELLKTCLSGQSGRPSQFDLLIHLLDQHHSTIDQLAATGPAPELVSSKALLNHCTRMHAECNTGVLPMLRAILKKNGNKLEIQLEGIELLVSPTNGLISKSKLAERGFNSQREYSIIQQSKNKNASVKVDWFGLGNYSGERFRDEPDLVMGTQALEWSKSPGHHMPLLSFTRTMAKSMWPNHVAPISKISSHGTSRLHELLGYSPESNTPLIIENGQTYLSSSEDAPVHMFIFMDKQLKGIRLDFKDSHSDTKSSVTMKLEVNPEGNPWAIRPNLKQATWIKETVVPTFGAVDLQSTLEWQPCGTVNTEQFTVLQQEDLRWQGALNGQQQLVGARLLDKAGEHTLLQFPVSEESDPIPLDALPLFSEISHSSLEGSYPFRAHYLDCTQKTPAPGFEGFVFKLPVGPYLFSGYLTANDRAMGVLYANNSDSRRYIGKQFVGNFLWLRNESDSDIRQTMGYSKEDEQTPIPHGRCAVVQVSPRDNRLEMEREHLFSFWNLAFKMNEKTASLKPFSAPGCMLEFKIRTQHGQSNAEETHFKLSQEPGDHYLSRPGEHATLQNYSIQYQNIEQFACKLLLISRTVRQGTLEFPNGLKYTGQLELLNSTLHLKGQGKMTWNDVNFKGLFDGNRVRNLIGLNPESKIWLNTLRGKTIEGGILLDDLLHDLAGHADLFSQHIAPALQLKEDLFRG